ncbi:single-stranded DNA-binding protein, mitochondrial [Gastrolobium bilobum]|uniref:single-stranded DNA-binding protein, mitochondrial n=1 Tax=Gastrolobium bilobum TaxID=150636 RepID=UPI002AB1DEE7|nr:single-stranded DNA-binding protein, mitochondrial [Gastrolobium bilobum]
MLSSKLGMLSRRVHRSLVSIRNPHHQLQLHFSTNTISDSDTDSTSTQQGERVIFDRPLENGLDAGIYRAILMGKAGQKPLQKKLKSGTVVTLLSIGTGGIRNNRRPLDNESPRDYADRCAIQWHRVTVYPERLGTLLMKNVLPGSILYVEGNLEAKVFADPMTGLVRRIREVAVRRNGRVIFLSQGGDAEQQIQQNDQRAVGYY